MGAILSASLGNNDASLWKQAPFETIVPVSLGKNHVSVTWKGFYQSLLGTIVPSSLGIIMPVSLGNGRTSVTWKQSFQCHLGAIAPVLLENNRAGLSL